MKKSKKLSKSSSKRKTSAAQLKAIQDSLPEDVRVERVKGMGRPTQYHPDLCMMLINHMSQGFDFESFAAKLEYMTAARLYDWTNRHKSFAEAKKVGEALCKQWWINMGRGAVGGKIPNFNASVWIFTMKNMFGWRDKHDIKSKHTDVKEVVHTVEIGLDGDISQIQNVIEA